MSKTSQCLKTLWVRNCFKTIQALEKAMSEDIKMKRWKIFLIIDLLLNLIIVFPSTAEVVQYDLNISYKALNVAGKNIKAIAINDSIPGPALRFREGDIARIYFKNNTDVATSVHWHGILLPYDQDVVLNVTDPLIEPGETKKFEFAIKQSGTYWFHLHAGLQEKRGVYGSIVITPKEGERVSADQSEVILLADWTNDDLDEVLHTLKSGNDYYSLKKSGLLVQVILYQRTFLWWDNTIQILERVQASNSASKKSREGN